MALNTQNLLLNLSAENVSPKKSTPHDFNSKNNRLDPSESRSEEGSFTKTLEQKISASTTEANRQKKAAAGKSHPHAEESKKNKNQDPTPTPEPTPMNAAPPPVGTPQKTPEEKTMSLSSFETLSTKWDLSVETDQIEEQLASFQDEWFSEKVEPDQDSGAFFESALSVLLPQPTDEMEQNDAVAIGDLTTAASEINANLAQSPVVSSLNTTEQPALTLQPSEIANTKPLKEASHELDNLSGDENTETLNTAGEPSGLKSSFLAEHSASDSEQDTNDPRQQAEEVAMLSLSDLPSKNSPEITQQPEATSTNLDPSNATPEGQQPDQNSPLILPTTFLNRAENNHPIAQALSLSSPIQSREFAQEMGDRMLWIADRNIKSAYLELNPPELGPLQIQLNLKPGEETASVHFMTQHLAVKQALEEHMPKLKEWMAEQGFNLLDAQVSSDQSSNQGGSQQSSQAQNALFSNRRTNLDSEEEPTKLTVHSSRLIRNDGHIDYYV